jgi:hypothetical protein
MEWPEEDLAQLTHRDVRGCAVLSRLRLSVCNEVLECRDDAGFVGERAVALEAPDRGDPHARHEIRIFTESLFDASPARVASNVHHGRQGLMRPPDSRLLGRHGVQQFDECWVECARETDGLWEAGATDGGVAVEAFLVEDDRDA